MPEFETLNVSTFPDHPEAKEIMRQIGWDIDPKRTEIGKHLEILVNILKEFEWPEEDIYIIELTFDEFLTNALLHGTFRIEDANDPALESTIKRMESDPEIQKKKIHVNLEISKKTARIIIQDEGGKKAKKAVDRMETASNLSTDQNLLKTSGRGSLIVDNLFDGDIKKEANDIGLKVTLTKTLNKKTSE